MSTRQFFAIAAATIALSVPAVSMASAAVHFVGGEIGYVEHQNFTKSTKSRAQVQAEVQAAMQDGSLQALQLSRQFSLPEPVSAAKLGPAKTRAEVLADLLNETPEQRRARQEWYSNGG